MAADEPNVLLMLEHPHTFTAGYRLSEADNDEARLRSLGADFHRVRFCFVAPTRSFSFMVLIGPLWGELSRRIAAAS